MTRAALALVGVLGLVVASDLAPVVVGAFGGPGSARPSATAHAGDLPPAARRPRRPRRARPSRAARPAGPAAATQPTPPAPASPTAAPAVPATPPTPPAATPPAPPAPPAPAPSPAPATPPTPAAARGPAVAPELPVAALAAPHDSFIADLDCSACHTAAGWQLSAGAGGGGFDHDRTGFALRGAHAQTTCLGCHGGPAGATGMAAPPTTCEGCHRDPHQRRVQGTCGECHTATAWSDTQALAQHRLTRMPLTGRHAGLACDACHRRVDDRRFTAVPTDCYGCHRQDYRRDLHPDHDGDPLDPGQRAFPRDCGRCHRTTGWSPAVVDPATVVARAVGAPAASRHDRWFVLGRGPHRDATCASCHVDPARPARVRCDACHRADAVRSQHRGAVGPSATGCLACHPRGQR